MPTFSISGPGSQAEGTGGTTAFSFTVTRTGDLSAQSLVDWWLWPFGVGANGEVDVHDFTGPTAGTAYFQPGQSSQTFSLGVVADSNQELNETFNITLSNPRNGDIQTGTAQATIVNDDGAQGVTLSWGNSVEGIARNEGNVGPTPFTYVLNRGGDTSGTTRADWNVQFGATDGSDFSGPTGGSVVFGPGELSKTIVVEVAGDLTVETDEVFQVAVSNSPGAALPPPIPGKILNDDGGGTGTTTISIGDVAPKAEGTGGVTTFLFDMTRTGDLSGSSAVDYFLWPTSGGGPGFADQFDFEGPTTGTIYFTPGESTRQLHVTVRGDTALEPDEIFNVSLSNPRGAVIGDGATQTMILNDDGGASTQLAWAVPGGIHKAEGNQGFDPPTEFVYVLNRTGDLSGTTTAGWTVIRGPVDEADFAGNPFGQVSFAPGETQKSIVVRVNGDLAVEPDEAFQLEVRDVVGAVGPPPNSGTIINDDGGAAPTTVSIAGSIERPEGNSGTTAWDYLVTRTGDLSGLSLVDFYVVGDVTRPEESTTPDFQNGTGTLYFQPGETEKTIRLLIVGDTTPEPHEAFTLGLSNPRGTALGNAAASGRILDDDGWVT